jgi:teichuronic acid biosynthesis glycosyltransferase TuaH
LTDRPLILVLGTADWNAPIATNQHYVTRELAKEYPVIFAEGLGTRRPTLSRGDLTRMVQRLRRVARPARPVASRPVPINIEVLSPFAIPLHSGWTRRLNTNLLAGAVSQWISYEGPKVLWTYTPYTYGLEHHTNASVFHLVDLIHNNRGVDAEGFLAAERNLARCCDIAIATSPLIGEHLSEQGFANVDVKMNVADVDIFFNAPRQDIVRPDMPVVVFAGNLRADKLDLDILRELSLQLAGKATLKLIGPIGINGDDRKLQKELRKIGAAITPPISLQELAVELSVSAVGIIPYQINGLTRGISPLKTFEYLSAGLSVVATPLPALNPIDDSLWIEETPEAFAARVVDLLDRDDLAVREQRVTIAKEHSWKVRGEELRNQLASVSVDKPLRPRSGQRDAASTRSGAAPKPPES